MSRTTIIAEAGVNHNGSIQMALELVDAAAKAGADVVKFQTFNAEAMVGHCAQKADYQKETTGAGGTQLEMLKQYELSERDHVEIMERCSECDIEFLSTPFDIPSLELLERMRLKRYKLSSGDITNWPLIHRIGMTGKPLIMSTGMSSLDEVQGALGVFLLGALAPDSIPDEKALNDICVSSSGRAYLEKNIILLHCTTQYPTPLADVNLLAMDLLKETFGMPVGYSDHTEGILASVCAVARGASVIEKHFTLDRSLTGPDHRASITPDELARLVLEVRMAELMLGKKEKGVTESEKSNVEIARKSLVALQDISQGAVFSSDNIGAKRPADGISPSRYWAFLRKTADKDYIRGERLR